MHIPCTAPRSSLPPAPVLGLFLFLMSTADKRWTPMETAIKRQRRHWLTLVCTCTIPKTNLRSLQNYVQNHLTAHNGTPSAIGQYTPMQTGLPEYLERPNKH